MAKFYGMVGYGQTVDKGNGVYEDEIVARTYSGDVIRNTRRLDVGEKVNDNLAVGNSISIVADAYANNHFFAIRYVDWAGTLWKVEEVEVQSPRLLLRLGGVYNGPKAAAPVNP